LRAFILATAAVPFLSACATVTNPCADALALLQQAADGREVAAMAEDCRKAGGEAYGLSLRAAGLFFAGDAAGAEADANRALELDPGNAFTLYFRGLAREQLIDLEGAAQDFAAAAEAGLDPAYRLKARGRSMFLADDFEGAFADFDAHVRAYPDDAEGLQLRGVTLVVMEKYAAAAGDLNRAIARAPYYLGPVSARAFLRYMTGDYAGAVPDFRTYLDKTPEGVRLGFLYFALLRSGVSESAAQAELAMRARTMDRSRYSGVIASLFLGETDGESFLQTMLRTGLHKSFENETEAYFYLGMKALFAGDRARAQLWFERTLATGVLRYDEIRAARKELKALGVEVGPRLPFPPRRAS
jgi:lipoprotein NlpI